MELIVTGYITGIPVSNNFNPSFHSREDTLSKYSLSANVPLILFVAGGGLGYGNSFSYFSTMLKINRDFSFAFIAGKNKKLKAKAEKIAKERTKNGIVLGHTDNMAELINAASIVVGKPGGLITTECIEMNTPICAVQPIPGQELKNIDFLTSNGFGIYPKTTHDFNQKVSELFDNPQILDGMKNNIMNYKVKNASKTIVKTFNKTIS